MPFVINIDQDNVDNYYLTINNNSLYSSVLGYINKRYSNSKEQVKARILSLAKGNTSVLDLNREVFKNAIKGYCIDNLNIPLGIQFTLQNVSQHSFEDLYKNYKTSNENKVPEDLFPLAVRYITQSGDYVIERPPFKTKVDFLLKGTKSIQGIEIWVPWTLTVINPLNVAETQIYFSHKQLCDESDKYIASILPNSYGNGKICFGASLYDISSDSSIAVLYSRIFNEYMTGGWNIDLAPVIRSYIHKGANCEPDGMVSRYINMEVEDLQTAYPKIQRKTLQNLVYNHEYNNYDRLDIFRYMFLTLGTFTLDETLKFYEELIDLQKPSNISTFDKIVSSENQSKTHFQRLSNCLLTNLPKSQNHDYSNLTIDFIVSNYNKTNKEFQWFTISDLMQKAGDTIAKTIENLIVSNFSDKDLLPGQMLLVLVDLDNQTETNILQIDVNQYETIYSDILIRNNAEPYTEENSNYLMSTTF